uniref:Uncharacterized protein n=1 Tax=Peronospora matthiolae TaxID=2874970 RepID=A0AAV1U954_9STRA
MRRKTSVVHGGHGLFKQTGRMDPGPSSEQATATPGRPGRIVQGGREEEPLANREPERLDETVGLGYNAKLTEFKCSHTGSSAGERSTSGRSARERLRATFGAP